MTVRVLPPTIARGVAAFVSGLVGFGLAGTAIACGDLFHDTTSIVPRCDGGSCAATDAGTDAGREDFCAWSTDVARAKAERACALLGACASPVGGNRFAECSISARLAFDCAVNPSRRPHGAGDAYWRCLSQATSCADVDRCVFVDGKPPCPEASNPVPYAACTQGGNRAVRVVCSGVPRAVPSGEACVRSGGTCVAGARGAECHGAGRCTDAGARCEGSSLVTCVPGSDVDRGSDCANVGAGECRDTDAGAVCVPNAGPACSGGRLVLCEGTTATRCTAGVVERVDCARLLPGGECDAREALPSDGADVACLVRERFDGGVVDAGGSPEDGCDMGPACDGTRLRSCARGARFDVDCVAVLGPGARCVAEKTVDDDGPRGRCVPPP
ncbi:MAG: hypothetical protein U0169_25065 [Polyangiaceae bacterium]